MINKDTSPELILATVRCPECGLELDASVPVCPNDGTKVAAVLEVGEMFENKYELIERIAAGGMGVVFKAKQKGLNRIVAIKVLQSANITPVSVRRFQQEAQALANVDHANLVRVFEMGVTTYHQPYTAMEFIDGIGLDDLIKQRGRLSLGKALNIFLQICDGLSYVHAYGVFHRDLKPSNIMLIDPFTDTPKVKLVDFGIAKVLDHGNTNSLTQTGDVFGSPLYMSPEQAKGTSVDQRADIYSLGCVMYDVLTGIPPFRGTSMVGVMMKQVGEKHKSLNSVISGQKYPNALEAIVDRMLEKDVEDRYQSIDDVKKELVALASQQRSWYHVKLPGVRSDTGLSQRAVLLLAAAAVLLVAGTSVAVMNTMFSAEKPANNKKPPPSILKLDDEVKVTEEFLDDADVRLKDGESTSSYLSKVAVLKQTADNILDLRMADPETFKYIKERPDKYVTELRSYKMTDAAMHNIEGLPLYKLSLREAPITDASLKYITAIKTLGELELNGVKLNADDCRALLKLHRLHDLILDNCDLNDECVKILCQNKRLTKLSLFGNTALSDASVRYITEAQLPLEELNLSSTSISDLSMPLLAKLPELQHLELGNLPLTNKSLPCLAQLKALRCLNVSNTAINDSGLSQFKPVKLLRLNLKNCRSLTAGGIKEFKQRTPDCAVQPLSVK